MIGTVNISIHVPAKGTTEAVGGVADELVISIHVPAKGTTSAELMGVARLVISIHVPAKGTTLYFCHNAHME